MIKKSLLAPVLTLCFVQVISTALITFIFPFVASLLLSMKIDEREVPIYAGWADSTISIADIICLPIHVRIIRHLPHRQLLVVTLIPSGGIAGLLGFCTSPWQLVALRGLTGLVHFGGFMSVIGLGEIVDEESRNEAFSWHAGGNAIGSMLGSVIGGYFSEPFGRVPVLAGVKLLQHYPYAAPGLLLCGTTILASAGVLLFVRETNHRHSAIVLPVDEAEDTPVANHLKGKLTTRTILRSRRFLQVSLAEFVNRACVFGCLALFSTAGKLSPAIGGLGLEISEIASVLSVTPLLTLINLLILFPYYSKHISLRLISAISSGCWLLPAAFFPIAAYYATHPTSGEGWVYGLWYVGQVGGMTWWTLKSLLLLRLYPHSDDRTLATGIIRLATNAGIITGAAGSTQMSSIASRFAAGTVGRQLAWIFLGGLAVITFAVGLSQPEMEEADPVLKLADSRPVDEETSLLGNDGEAAE